MAEFKNFEFQAINTPKRFSPDPGVDKTGFVDSVGKALDAGYSVYKKNQKENAIEGIESEMEQTGKIVATINEAQAISGKGSKTFDEKRGDVLLIDGAPEEFTNRYNEVMKESGEEFRAIASGVAQGATPKAAAALQIEAKLKEYTNLYPEFSDELKSTVRSLTGYDATGYHLKQLLNIHDTGSKGSKTFAEKKEEEVQFMARTLGLSPDLVRHGIAKELYTEQNRKIRENQVKTGSMTANNLILSDVSETGPYMENFWVEQANILKTGGVVNPEMQLTMLDKAQAEHRAELMSEIRKTSKSFGVDVETTKFLDEQLKALYDPIKESVKRNDFGKILSRQGDTMLELDKQFGRKTWPRLVRMNNALGERLTSTIIDQMASFANNEQWQLYVRQQPLLNEAVNGANMSPEEVANRGLDVYEKVMTNQPLSEEDRKWLPTIEPIVFHPKQDPELRQLYLEGEGKIDSRGVGWLAQPGKRSMADKKDVDWMKREWKQTVPALIKRVASQIEDRPDRKIVVTPDGKLRMVTGAQRGNQRPVFNKDLEQLQYFVNAAKNGWAADFNTSADGVLKDISSQITQEVQDVQGTAKPDVLESVSAGVSSVVESLSGAIKEYEDIVTGKKPSKDPNKQLKGLYEKIKKITDKIPSEFKGEDINGTEK